MRKADTPIRGGPGANPVQASILRRAARVRQDGGLPGILNINCICGYNRIIPIPAAPLWPERLQPRHPLPGVRLQLDAQNGADQGRQVYRGGDCKRYCTHGAADTRPSATDREQALALLGQGVSMPVYVENT